MNNSVNCREITGFPGYRVGSDGSVWSRRPLNGKGPLVEKWRLKAPNRINFCGHLRVDLYRGHGERFLKYVHRLVLEAFVGPCPEGMECCHADGNPANNVLENLRWDTPSANQADRNKHGTDNRGVRHPLSKLSEEDVRSIRRLWSAGELSQPEIGKRFGITQSYVSEIVLRKRWIHV